jgi:hypothetical protein
MNKFKLPKTDPKNIKTNIGIANKKEKFTAVLFLKPIRIATAIVMPDLDIPGIIAKHWARPIINAIP